MFSQPFDVSFKIGDQVIFKTKAFMGDMRMGEPRDTFQVVVNAQKELVKAMESGQLPDDSWNKTTAVTVSESGGKTREFLRQEIREINE